MARPAKAATVENRIAELEHERSALAAQLAGRVAEQETAERATSEAQALAVRDGSDAAQKRAREAETQLHELSLAVLRLQSATRAVERDITDQRAELEAAIARERQHERDRLRSQRDQVLEQLDATPTNRALWVELQQLYDRDRALARAQYGEGVALAGADGYDTLWCPPGRIFERWAASLEHYVFRGKGQRAPTLRELAD